MTHTTPEDTTFSQDAINHMGVRARLASRILREAKTERKNAALRESALAIRRNAALILDANAQDLALAQRKDLKPSFLDRLFLNADRIEAIAKSFEAIAELPDPVGKVTAEWTEGLLDIQRVLTPIGVIGVIFESRPNVTTDAAALCLKAGNAVLLRSGGDALGSALALFACIEEALAATDLPAASAQIVRTKNRAAVDAILGGLNGAIDVVIPRGGKSLVARIQSCARVPVFSHLDGNNHVYIHGDADVEKAIRIALNAKMRRTGICGSAETFLIDHAIADVVLPRLVSTLFEAGCAIRGDAATQKISPRVEAAREEDWATEYLEAIVAIKVVEDLKDAIAHIERYGSHHTDAIVTENKVAAETFLRRVDSAITLHNASTQFADGKEMGFGAEIGIATGRLHARGPIGLEQLNCFNYRVRAKEAIRP